MWLKNKLVAVGSALLLLVGCMSAPVEHYAKSGEYVHIPIGSVIVNAQMRYIKPSDIALSIVDSAGVTHQVKVIKTFRVFADPAATNSWNAIDGGYFKNTRADDGVWMVQARLVDPSTGYALPLAVGAAHFEIVSSKLSVPASHNDYAFDANNLPIEILPGTAPNIPLSGIYADAGQQSKALINLAQIEFVPQGLETLDPWADENPVVLAGAQYVFTFNYVNFGELMPRVERIIPDKRVQMLISFSEPDANNIITAKVVLMNPHGFYSSTGGDDPKSTAIQYGNNGYNVSAYEALNMNFIWSGGNGSVTDANWQESIQLVESESYYFDKAGNKLSGITTLLQKVN